MIFFLGNNEQYTKMFQKNMYCVSQNMLYIFEGAFEIDFNIHLAFPS